MTPYTLNINKIMFKRVRKSISIFILAAFVTTSIRPPAYAQMVQNFMLRMPAPGAMVSLSPAFTPAILKGIVIHQENALKFDFIIYKGDQTFNDQQKKQEYKKLIKYFLASLAVPDDNQWVNLSPYEKDRIIKEDFGKTEMGRDLLAQDYMLKQITASLIYPQDKLGQKFWDTVYTRAQQQFGTSNIPVNTFNKVWIVPDDALIYEKGNMAYVVKNHLKVMLEEDYLSLAKHTGIESQGANKTHTIASQVVREIVVPALEKEVNEGKNFATLRQAFSGVVLAAWYKRALKESLLGKIYMNQSRLKGVDQNPKNNEVIYKQYLKAFKKGVFNFIKEDVDKYTNETIPRKYFSGGEDVARAYNEGVPGVKGGRPVLVTEDALQPDQRPAVAAEVSNEAMVAVEAQEANSAMTAEREGDRLALDLYSAVMQNQYKKGDQSKIIDSLFGRIQGILEEEGIKDKTEAEQESAANSSSVSVALPKGLFREIYSQVDYIRGNSQLTEPQMWQLIFLRERNMLQARKIAIANAAELEKAYKAQLPSELNSADWAMNTPLVVAQDELEKLIRMTESADDLDKSVRRARINRFKEIGEGSGEGSNVIGIVLALRRIADGLKNEEAARTYYAPAHGENNGPGSASVLAAAKNIEKATGLSAAVIDREIKKINALELVKEELKRMGRAANPDQKGIAILQGIIRGDSSIIDDIRLQIKQWESAVDKDNRDSLWEIHNLGDNIVISEGVDQSTGGWVKVITNHGRARSGLEAKREEEVDRITSLINAVKLIMGIDRAMTNLPDPVQGLAIHSHSGRTTEYEGAIGENPVTMNSVQMPDNTWTVVLYGKWGVPLNKAVKASGESLNILDHMRNSVHFDNVTNVSLDESRKGDAKLTIVTAKGSYAVSKDGIVLDYAMKTAEVGNNQLETETTLNEKGASQAALILEELGLKEVNAQGPEAALREARAKVESGMQFTNPVDRQRVLSAVNVKTGRAPGIFIVTTRSAETTVMDTKAAMEAQWLIDEELKDLKQVTAANETEALILVTSAIRTAASGTRFSPYLAKLIASAVLPSLKKVGESQYAVTLSADWTLQNVGRNTEPERKPMTAAELFGQLKEVKTPEEIKAKAGDFDKYAQAYSGIAAQQLIDSLRGQSSLRSWVANVTMQGIIKRSFSEIADKVAQHMKVADVTDPKLHAAALAEHVGYVVGRLAEKHPEIPQENIKKAIDAYFENNGDIAALRNALPFITDDFLKSYENDWMFCGNLTDGKWVYNDFKSVAAAVNTPGVYAFRAAWEFSYQLAANEPGSKYQFFENFINSTSEQKEKWLAGEGDYHMVAMAQFSVRAAQLGWLVSQIGKGFIEAEKEQASSLKRWKNPLVTTFDEMAKAKGWKEVVKDMEQIMSGWEHWIKLPIFSDGYEPYLRTFSKDLNRRAVAVLHDEYAQEHGGKFDWNGFVRYADSRGVKVTEQGWGISYSYKDPMQLEPLDAFRYDSKADEAMTAQGEDLTKAYNDGKLNQVAEPAPYPIFQVFDADQPTVSRGYVSLEELQQGYDTGDILVDPSVGYPDPTYVGRFVTSKAYAPLSEVWDQLAKKIGGVSYTDLRDLTKILIGNANWASAITKEDVEKYLRGRIESLLKYPAYKSAAQYYLDHFGEIQFEKGFMTHEKNPPLTENGVLFLTSYGRGYLPFTRQIAILPQFIADLNAEAQRNSSRWRTNNEGFAVLSSSSLYLLDPYKVALVTKEPEMIRHAREMFMSSLRSMVDNRYFGWEFERYALEHINIVPQVVPGAKFPGVYEGLQFTPVYQMRFELKAEPGQKVNAFRITSGGPMLSQQIAGPGSLQIQTSVQGNSSGVDRAALAKGGIDFNAANLNLQIKRDGKGVPLPISQQNLENIHIDGLIPVIINIQPATASPLLAEFQSPGVQGQMKI